MHQANVTMTGEMARAEEEQCRNYNEIAACQALNNVAQRRGGREYMAAREPKPAAG